jgi:hypothetical protein
VIGFTPPTSSPSTSAQKKAPVCKWRGLRRELRGGGWGAGVRRLEQCALRSMVPENDAVKINKSDCPQLDLFDWRPPVPDHNGSCARRARSCNLQVMQMKPGTRERLEVLRKLEVSCRAEVKLPRKALAYYIRSSQGDQRRNLRQRRRRLAQRSLTLSIHDFAVAAASRAMPVIP